MESQSAGHARRFAATATSRIAARSSIAAAVSRPPPLRTALRFSPRVPWILLRFAAPCCPLLFASRCSLMLSIAWTDILFDRDFACRTSVSRVRRFSLALCVDVISLPKTSEQFRLLYDIKGRFVLHRITPEEASYKLCRVQKIDKANKASIGHNPFHTGQLGAIPYVVTHDGRTVRFADPAFRTNDTIKIDIKTGRPVGHLKFDVGQLAMITRGANVGRVGSVVSVERHPGSFDIAHLKGQ